MNHSGKDFKIRVQRVSHRLKKYFFDRNLTIGEKVEVVTSFLEDGTSIRSVYEINEKPSFDESAPKHIPFFQKKITLSSGLTIEVSDIINAIGEGKKDEVIAKSFRVPNDEILAIRRKFKLLRHHRTKRERTADIISLVKPIFKTLTKNEKEIWAKRLKISISQLYRIIGKDYNQVTASIPLNPCLKKRIHFDSRIYTWEAEIKYCNIVDLKSGRRTKRIENVSKKDLKISDNYASAFKSSTIIVEPAPLVAISISEFKDLWRNFKFSDNPDRDMAKKFGFDIGRIREIRTLHNCELSNSLKDNVLIENLIRAMDSHNIYKIFDRKQKEYSGQSAPNITSIDKICDTYGISRATLYRRLAIAIDTPIPEISKRCYTIIKINQRWYDIDSFVHGKKSPMRYISFSI